MKDVLGDRMKEYYESRTRLLLPRRTYTIIRIDGKAFHTYTKGLQRPFDDKLMNDMDETAGFLCKNIQGAKFAFVQSDEISILLTDFEELTTDAWFDGNIQKIVSVSASLATAKFNELRPRKLAFFDSRVFIIPSNTEVENYFIWRQQDTTRNSISSVAQTLYSHKELEGKNVSVQQEMIFQKGINWNDYAPKYKRGRVIEKTLYDKDGAVRTKWVSVEPPIFYARKRIYHFKDSRMITDDDIAFGYSLILSDFISFDLWLDWRCEMAKRELYQRIDQRRVLDGIEQEIKRLKVKVEDHYKRQERINFLCDRVEKANFFYKNLYNENRLRTRLYN